MVRFIFSFLFADPMSVTDSKKSSKWPPWSSDICVIVSLQQFLGEEKSNNTYFFFKTLTDYTPFRWRLFRVSNISAMTTINTTKNTAAEDAAIIMTVGKELLLSSVITVVGMKTVVEDPGLNELVF